MCGERQADVEDFWNGGKLNPESNVQFGEGGAGTFSDGKLNTQVKDKSGRNRFVLETFVDCGAPEDILFGGQTPYRTDILRTVVANMRREIIRMGGTFYFSSCVTDFRFGKGGLKALQINHRDWQPVSAAVLAVGHSARDTFAVLKRHQIPMVPKAFAVGFRVEHPQQMINENQYGTGKDSGLLPAAFYKLACRTQTGRNVYSFCMCPGRLCGQRLLGRGAAGGQRDERPGQGQPKRQQRHYCLCDAGGFPGSGGSLIGIEFQRILEEKAWKAGRRKDSPAEIRGVCGMCAEYGIRCGGFAGCRRRGRQGRIPKLRQRTVLRGGLKQDFPAGDQPGLRGRHGDFRTEDPGL